MMKLFQKVQARKTVVFAPKLKNGEVKEPKQIAQKKRVPRYLTRDIILKLKKNQSICSTLAFAKVAFIFYQNESKNKGKENAAENITSCLFFAPEVKDQEDKYNKNVRSLKEHKPVFPNYYTINIQPIQVLQKK